MNNIITRVQEWLVTVMNRVLKRGALETNANRLSLFGDPITPKDRYDILLAYYLNNSLYKRVEPRVSDEAIYATSNIMWPLKTPAFRVVEFHVRFLWPGMLPDALPVVSDNEKLPAAIEQIWKWSNWSQRKQVAARFLALFGDLFMRVSQSADKKRVYHQIIDPRHVVDFEKDERGFLVMIRTDIEEIVLTMDQQVTTQIRTEIWDKKDGTKKVFIHTKGWGASVSLLDAPTENLSLQEAFGINFVPFIHAAFMDAGEKRGASAFMLAIDKIDSANRMASRRNQVMMRFNDNTWVLENPQGFDPVSNKPLPPLKVDEKGGTLMMGGEKIMALPGGAVLKSTVPQLDYIAWNNAIDDQTVELEKDLPELTWWRLREKGDLSGKAIRLLLGDAIAKVEEARGNAETALAQLDAMALTVAQNARLPGFENLGSFDAGDFEHSFAHRDVIPLSEGERAELVQAYTSAGVSKRAALKRAGWTETEIDDEEQTAQAETSAATDAASASIINAMNQALAGQGQNPGLTEPIIPGTGSNGGATQ